MLIELGNVAPKGADGFSGQRVTYITVPDADTSGLGGYTHPSVHDDSLLPVELARNVAQAPGALRMLVDGWLAHPSGVRGLPDHEAFVSIVHGSGAWANHSTADPTWVRSADPSMEGLLARYFGCAAGVPADLEDTWWTRNGPPGVGPGPYGGATMLVTNSGFDVLSLLLGGGLLGETGTATATSATSLTTNSAVSHATNDLAGQVVVAWSNGAYGLVTANTSGTNTVLTTDRWYAPATPGGSAASTPSGTTGYTIMTGAPPAFFMGLTANSATPVATDVALASEISTSGGGLIRKICPYAHTAGTSTFTLTPVFTANASDSLPVTVAKIGVSASITSGVRNLAQTLLNATATFSLIGDQATVTWTATV